MGLFDAFKRNKKQEPSTLKTVEDVFSSIKLPSLSEEQKRYVKESIEKDKKAPKTEIIKSSINIEELYPEIKFDFSDIVIIDEKRNNLQRIVVTEPNLETVKKHIEYITTYKDDWGIPKEMFPAIDTRRINFNYSNYDNRIDFCYFKYSPYTEKKWKNQNTQSNCT